MKGKTILMLPLLLGVMPGSWAQSDVSWSGSGTDADPYLLCSTADWLELGTQVAQGNNFSGQVIRMTADIDGGNDMVGTEAHPFSGTFDGDGHTLTLNAGTNADPVTTGECAPFRYASGATIRHLTTAGTICTNSKFAGGIIARVSGSASTTLTDCHSVMTSRVPSMATAPTADSSPWSAPTPRRSTSSSARSRVAWTLTAYTSRTAVAASWALPARPSPSPTASSTQPSITL